LAKVNDYVVTFYKYLGSYPFSIRVLPDAEVKLGSGLTYELQRIRNV
jgi:hypothetical protein